MKSNGELCNLISKAKTGDEEAIEAIIERFMRLITNRGKELRRHYIDDDTTPLIEAVINAIEKISIYEEEGNVFEYIHRAIDNKYYALIRQNNKIKLKEQKLINEYFEYIEQDNDMIELCLNKIILKQLLDMLTKYQQKVIIQLCFNDVSTANLAKKLHISRQSINKTKNVALKNLIKFSSQNY